MRIVVGDDGSESAKRALEPASSVATDQDKVVVVAAAGLTPGPQSQRALTSTRPRSSAGATISRRRRLVYPSAGSKQKRWRPKVTRAR